MSAQNVKLFSFESVGNPSLPADTFSVVSFKGYEALSQLYNFEIKLVTENTEIDLGDVLKYSARFTIHRDGGDDAVINGELARFEEISRLKDKYILYRALLVPRLQRLTLARSNQVFLGQRVQAFLETVLKDPQVGLTDSDYRFDLLQQPAPPTPPATPPTYPQVEYVSQYNESHFNFISRWLEREGIYYFFERTATGDKAVFVDEKNVHTDLARGDTLTYAPDSPSPEIIASFTCRRQTIPGKVVLKDYNYETPAVDLERGKDVDAISGRGDVYLYGENYTTDTEGERLAGIRAEEFSCRRELYLGESNVPFMQPGYIFTLQGHYRAGNNERKYLIVDVTHEGRQTGYLVSIDPELPDLSVTEQSQDSYRNSFTVIPAAVQFRAERRAEKPRVFGTVNAKIDGAQSGDYAELDDKGRYKVKLPFDLVSTRTAGQNSCYVRMMQPYSGINKGGFHFPLHKGAEVLLSFINGDPDRPVIAGAVPNPVTPSVIKDETQQTGKIITDGGNYIEFDDTKDKEYVEIYSPYDKNSKIRLGYDPDIGEGIFAYSEGDWFNACGGDASITVLGNSAELFVGAQESVTIAETFELFAGLSQSIGFGHATEISIGGSRDYQPTGLHVTFPREKLTTVQKDTLAKVIETKAAIKSKIKIVNSSIKTYKTGVESTLDTKIEPVKQKVGVCKTEIGTASKKIKCTNSKVKAAKSSLKTSKTSITKANTKITAVETALTKSETVIEDVKTSIDKNQTSLDKIPTILEKVDTKVKNGPIMIM